MNEFYVYVVRVYCHVLNQKGPFEFMQIKILFLKTNNSIIVPQYKNKLWQENEFEFTAKIVFSADDTDERKTVRSISIPTHLLLSTNVIVGVHVNVHIGHMFAGFCP